MQRVDREEEEVKRALRGEGSYLGLTLSCASGGSREELLMHLQALRAEKLQLQEEKGRREREREAYERDEKAKEKAYERDEKAKEMAHKRDEEAKERAFEREKEAKLFDEKAKEKDFEREKELQAEESGSPERRDPINPDEAGDEEGEVGGRRGGTKRRRAASGGEAEIAAPVLGRTAPGRPPALLAGDGSSCAEAVGSEEVYGKVMELVGPGEYAFVATVCKEWRDYYIVAHRAETSQTSVVASIERVYWARRHGYELTVETLRAATQYGGVSMCKALHHMGCPRDVTVYKSAAKNKHHVSVLKWLCSDDWSVCANAAQKGDLPLLKLVLSDDMNAPFDHRVWLNAIDGGHISVLEGLLNNPRVRAELEGAEEGSAWRQGAGSAADCSRLPILRWLHANARELCDWDATVCADAVQGPIEGLAMLQWLRSEEVGCAWDEGVCPENIRSEAKADGLEWFIPEDSFEEIKQWVHANGHPCDCED